MSTTSAVQWRLMAQSPSDAGADMLPTNGRCLDTARKFGERVAAVAGKFKAADPSSGGGGGGNIPL